MQKTIKIIKNPINDFGSIDYFEKKIIHWGLMYYNIVFKTLDSYFNLLQTKKLPKLLQWEFYYQ